MPKETKDETFTIYDGADAVATAEAGCIYMHDHCVQAKCTIVTGAAKLKLGSPYRIVRSGGMPLEAMYCDEKPVDSSGALAQTRGMSGFTQFVVGGGFARFSNHKTVDNRVFPVSMWTFGKAPGAKGGLGDGSLNLSHVNKSKLSFGDDL